jgi:hypothetical protein
VHLAPRQSGQRRPAWKQLTVIECTVGDPQEHLYWMSVRLFDLYSSDTMVHPASANFWRTSASVNRAGIFG